MTTFQEYQSVAAKVPASLRNNRDRILLPISGLQQEAGKIGSVLSKAIATGQFVLSSEHRSEVKDRLADLLWCMALLCEETGISMQDVANHSEEQLQARMKGLDPDHR